MTPLGRRRDTAADPGTAGAGQVRGGDHVSVLQTRACRVRVRAALLEAGRVHGGFPGHVRPASTVEADAVDVR